MLSKAKKKLITSLAQKKYRDQLGVFLVEGPKMITDLINSGMKPEFVVCSDQWSTIGEIATLKIETVIIPSQEFKQISLLKTPQHVLGVFKKPGYHLNNNAINSSLTLALDGIQDPGNLGTIIRLADWFGITDVICSSDCVDVFNPKTVQATMGAIARVKVYYTDLKKFCQTYKDNSDNPVYGAFLQGESIYNQSLMVNSLIIMGNEGAGIRPEIEKFVTKKITIPDFSEKRLTSESLNVGVATAIICAEFKRQSLTML